VSVTEKATSAIVIVPATMAHAARIELRAADAREIWAHGTDKMTALRLSMDRSLWADAYIADGEVAAIVGCGLSCMLGGHHRPWLVTGQVVDRHRKEFLRLTRARLEEMKRQYPVMVNWVHADHRQSLRWLAWLGFEIDAPLQIGLRGEKFCRVHLGERA
jgi:hypothetical protein